MKLTLLLMVCFMTVSSRSLAQNITLNATGVPLKTVLKEIKKQSGYSFVVDEKLLDNANPVILHIKNADINEALKQLFQTQQLIYTIENKVITIKEKPGPQKVAINPLSRAGNGLAGTVRDSLNRPIIGATVSLSPGNLIVATNKEGVFSFSNIPKQSYTLKITSIGYRPLEMNLDVNEETRGTILVLILKESALSLNEVSINTGYQLIKPEQSTGAVSRIGTKDYESQISTDFLSGLANKVTGLLINNDAANFRGSLFQIRGISTISGNSQPLIVLDGYPTEQTLDMIDPNEIKSVTVLKDAAAAAIFGVRASNGVIVIERKQASQGKQVLDFRATYGFTPKDNYSRYRWDPDASADIVNYERTLYRNAFSAGTWANITNANSTSPTNYPAPAIVMVQQAAGLITADQANREFAALGAYNNSSDYSKLFLRTAATQTYNLDMSGGNQKALYYITANYTNNDLKQKNNDNNRFLLSARTTLNFSKRFSLELTTDYQEGRTNTSPIPDINQIYPFEHFKDNNGNPLPVNIGSIVNPYYNANTMSLGFLDQQYYPLVDMDQVTNTTHTVNNRVTANFRYLLGKGFDLTFGGIYEHSNERYKYYDSEQSSVAKQIINTYATVGANGITYNIPQGGYLQESNQETSSLTGRAQLNYNKHIGKDHSINAIIGTEIRNVTNQYNSAAYFGYNDQTLLQQPVNYQTLMGSTFVTGYFPFNGRLNYNNLFNQYYEDDRFLSGYSNIVYSFRNKYSLTGSVRIDQSNLFGTNPKYHYKPLWSLGTAWNIDQEKFMQNISWVKALKMRIAYGFNGNIATNALPQVIAQAGFNKLGPVAIPQLSLSSYANSGLRWEQTKNFNWGLDYTIFKNVSGSFDFYDKKSTDILSNIQIDPFKGGSSALVNSASIDNRGIEASLHADWISRPRFNWNTGFILSHNTSKVLQVYNNNILPNSASYLYLPNGNTGYLQGYPVGAIFSYKYAGVDKTGYPLIYGADGNAHQLLNPDGGKGDVEYSGNSIPGINAGLSNRVDVGNFYFYCMINYYGDFKVRVPLPNPGVIRPLAGSNNYWKQAGDENIPGILPSIPYLNPSTDPYINYLNTYVVNGDYFTLGDVTASYNIGNTPFLKKAGFSHFEVKLQAQNIYTVALNKYNYSVATGSYAKPYVTPTYTIGLFTTF